MQKACSLVVASTQFNGFVILVVGDVLSTAMCLWWIRESRYAGIDKVYVCAFIGVSVSSFERKISGWAEPLHGRWITVFHTWHESGTGMHRATFWRRDPLKFCSFRLHPHGSQFLLVLPAPEHRSVTEQQDRSSGRRAGGQPQPGGRCSASGEGTAERTPWISATLSGLAWRACAQRTIPCAKSWARLPAWGRRHGPAAMSGGGGGSPNNTEWRFNQTLRNVQG